MLVSESKAGLQALFFGARGAWWLRAGVRVGISPRTPGLRAQGWAPGLRAGNKKRLAGPPVLREEVFEATPGLPGVGKPLRSAAAVHGPARTRQWWEGGARPAKGAKEERAGRKGDPDAREMLKMALGPATG